MKSKYLLLSFIFILIISGPLLFSACSQELPTYEVQGTVVCEGNPVAGVTISSDLLSEPVVTDDNGKFVITGLTSQIALTADVEGYHFKTKTLYATFDNHNISFECFRYYTLTGKVESNSIGVSGALVTIEGDINATTTTDNNGEFTIVNLIGNVTVDVAKDGYLFERKTANQNQRSLTISGTTSITANVLGVEQAVTISVNDREMIRTRQEYSLDNVSLGSIVTPTLQGYIFEPSSIRIVRENQVIDFTAYKLYNVSGVVHCGQTPITNAIVKVGNLRTQTDTEGKFVFESLYGENIISFSHPIYSLKNVVANLNKTSLDVEGTFSFNGRVVLDDVGVFNLDVKLGDITTTTNESGNFSFTGVKYGDTIEFLSDEYKIDNIVISNFFQQTNAFKYYNLQLKVMEDDNLLEGASITIDNVTYSSNARGIIEIQNLLNSYTTDLELNGYETQQISFDKNNCEKTIYLRKYYTISIYAHSGELVLNDAVVYVDDQVQTLTNGRIEIQNLLEPVEIYAYIDDYNEEFEFIADKNNNSCDFNFSYDISGYVRSGGIYLENVQVNAGNKTVKTDDSGEFSLTLYGEQTISCSLNNFDFFDENDLSLHTITVQNESEDINFIATYSIRGTLKGNGDEPLENVVVTLSGDTTLTTTTNAQGIYIFENLEGEFALTIDTEQTLYPTMYSVSTSGEYNFSSSGYAASGRVTCGGNGVAGVTLIAVGDNISTQTSTDRNGNYTFPLLIGDVVVSASKTGYVFSSDVNLSAPQNKTDDVVANFTCTYSVVGRIISGTQNVFGVEVCLDEQHTAVTDESGEFAFEGLEGSYTLSLTKVGYSFVFNSNINGYANLSINSNVLVSGVVKSGSLAISNATISYHNKSIQTNANGEFVLTDAVLGDCIVITKNGYDIVSNYTIQAYNDEIIVFNGTYGISGAIKSRSGILSDVLVKYGNEQIVSTNGVFEITGLEGSVTFMFEKIGYTFANVTIQEYQQNINIVATSFTVSGNITIGNVALQGVSVIPGQGSGVVTDANGNYTISGLTNSGNLRLVMEGYEFSGKTAYIDATTLDFSATYSVKVAAVNGSLGRLSVDEYVLNVINADNSILSNDKITEDAVNKYYTISGITSAITIEIVCTNYSDGSIVVDSYSAAVNNVYITYDIELNLDKALDSFNVQIISDDTNSTSAYSGKKVSIRDLSGETTIRISKTDYVFVYDNKTTPTLELKFNKNKVINNISFKTSYTVTGRLTYNSSTPIVGAVVEAGTNKVYTDSNGNYALVGLMDNNTISYYLPATNEIGKTTIGTESVSSACVKDKNYTNNNYQLWFVANGYQKLRNANGYRNLTTGTVKPSMGGDQSVQSAKYKDNTGAYYIENKNYGNEVAGVDPKVSLTAYYRPSKADLVVYHQNQNIDSSFNTTYASSEWKTSNRSGYASTYGGDPTGLYNYIINTSTIKSYGGITKSGSNYTVTLNLNTDTAVTNYLKQMKALSNQSPTFSSIQLVYTINENGELVRLNVTESYSVKVVITINITANLTETFALTDGSESLRDRILQAKYNLPSSITSQI